jgi:GT2 family glycosyltransferase
MSAAIAVIVPTRNRAHLLARCLDSLANQTLAADRYTVFVVDDGSSDETVRLLRSRNISYKSVLPCGPAAARNLGVRATQSELVAFIDDDAVADKEWLASALHAYRQGRFHDAAEGDVIREGEDLPLTHSVHHLGPGGFLTCNLVITRESFEKTGGFNEQFRFPMNEDFDFFLRLKKSGEALEYLPELRVFHPVEKIRFWPAFLEAREFAQRRVKSDSLLFRLHPDDYTKVKADSNAAGTLHRLSTRYAYAYGLRPFSRLIRHPLRSVPWLVVCLARQAAFLRLRLKDVPA